MRTISLAFNPRPLTKTLHPPRIAAVGVLSLLAALGFMCLGVASALAQTASYCECSSCTCTGYLGSWNPPFWWIPNGGTAYSKGTSGSTCFLVHHTSTMALGEGWGVIHASATLPGDGASVVYEVEIVQPGGDTATDIIYGVASTNCAIGGLSGGAGYPTNTTAFQATQPPGNWAFVCWLTNNPGVVNPEIEFRYVSGGADMGLLTYVDCIRFVQLPLGLPAYPAITNFGFAGGQCSIGGTGGLGKTFVLLQTTNFAAPVSSWTPVQTNVDGVGAFGFTVEPGAAPSAFFRVQAQ